MTEIAPETLAFAEHVAALPSGEDRDRAVQQYKQLLLAQLPDDEVGRPPVRSLGEYLDAEIEVPPILVEPGLVARGAITAMTARGGKGKTTLSLNRFIRWGMGKPVFDELPEVALTPRPGTAQVLAPSGPLRILLIENEGAAGHFQFVLNVILNAGERDEAGRVVKPYFTDEERELARENVFVWGDGGWSGLKLDNEENCEMVGRAAAETEADIVFVEPFRGLWKGEENSSTEMSNVLDAMSEIANTHQCAVMLTHHERKSGVENREDAMSAARGSGALEGHAAVMERWAPLKGNRQRELSWTKWRFAERAAPIRAEWDRRNWGYRLVKEDEGKRECLNFLAQFPSQFFGAKDVAEEIDDSYDHARKWLIELAEESRLRKRSEEGKVKYAYSQSGEDDDSTLAIT